MSDPKLHHVSERNCADLFSEVALEIEKEWGSGGLSGTMYEAFARACFNRYFVRRYFNEKRISVDFLLELHPELSEQEAISLKEFAKSQTITLKECYGDGSIIYPKWKQVNSD